MFTARKMFGMNMRGNNTTSIPPAGVQLAFASIHNATTNTSVNTASNTGSNDTTPFGAANTAGNMIFYMAAADQAGSGSQPVVAMSDSNGNAYTKIGGIFDSALSTYTEIGYAANIQAGANTVTASFSNFVVGSFIAVAAFEVSGLSSAPFNAGEFSVAQLSLGGQAGVPFNSGNTPVLSESNGFMIGFASELHNTLGPALPGSGFTQFPPDFWTFSVGALFATIEVLQLTSNAAQSADFITGPNGFNGDAYAAVFKRG